MPHFLDKFLRDPNKKLLKGYAATVERVNGCKEAYAVLADDALKAKTTEFRGRMRNGEDLNDLLPEAFAAVRESAKRTLGQFHFDVQVLGGIALHHRAITEMRTGEGKTLTATLPVYLNALEGKGAHVATVNDYLSMRDAAWMGQVFYALGMSVGVIAHEGAFLYDPSVVKDEPVEDTERDATGSFRVQHDYLRPVLRTEAYAADITYGTNNEYGLTTCATTWLRDRSNACSARSTFVSSTRWILS